MQSLNNTPSYYNQSINILNNSHIFENCLIKGIPNAKVLTEGEEFESANYQWNLRNPITPSGIFIPSSKDQIKIAMECSIITNIHIIPKSGGHSYEKHSFGTGKEIIIDLTKLNKISVDKETELASIEAGALLGHVYYELFNQGGYALPGGSCTGVGISGHTLGGGYGLSARKHGLIVDNLVEIDIILPDGKSVVASKDNHSDLFWALRGAGSQNFGIVTSFKFKVFKPPEKVYRILYQYKFNQFETAFNSFQKWTAINPDQAITTICNFGKNGFNINSVIQPDSEDQLNRILSQLESIFPKTYYNNQTLFEYNFLEMIRDFSDIKLNSTIELKKLNHSIQPKKYFKAKSTYINRELTEKEILEWKRVIEEAPTEYLALLDMQGGAISNLERNSTAFVHRKNSLYSMQLIVEYSPDSLEKVNYNWLNIYFNRLNHLFSGEAYQNYIDNEEPLIKYYGENLDKLIRVKKEYDPGNRFSNELTIPLD